MAGIGKTCLAVHVAHRAAQAFPDGQVYVDLRGADPGPTQPAEVLASFLHALGVEPRCPPDDLAELSALYRSRLAGRRVLVLLDNAASAQQVRSLLPGSATSAVLITSRVPLTEIESSRWLRLDVLTEGSAVNLLAEVVADGRVQRQPGEACELVRLCGHLPLAVRVAGARLARHPVWDLSRLVTALSDERPRLDLLAIGDLEVRASLALSYTGLDEVARRLFRRLSLFDVPDFTMMLAASVLDAPAAGILAAVEQLVEAQLLNAVGVDRVGQVRYRFHDLVQLFGREQAEVEDGVTACTAALVRGFGAWLSVAERLAAKVPGPCYAHIGGEAPRHRTPWDDEIVSSDPLSWFDAEWPTLRSALRQASNLSQHEVAFDLAGCLEKYCDVRGLYVEWEPTTRTCWPAVDVQGTCVAKR